MSKISRTFFFETIIQLSGKDFEQVNLANNFVVSFIIYRCRFLQLICDVLRKNKRLTLEKNTDLNWKS